MSLKLRIYMLDLLAFVHKDTDLWVLWRDARGGGTTSTHKPLTEHYPIVLFDMDDTGVGNDWSVIATLLKLSGPRGAPPQAWLLNAEEVIVPSQIAEPPGVRLYLDAPGVYPVKGSGSETNFGWVPKMSSISPAHAQIDGNLITGALPLQKIIARLQLTQGLIETFNFCKFQNLERNEVTPQIHSFEFRRLVDPSSLSRSAKALAEVVVATINLDGQTVDIKTSKGRSITLRTRDGQTINLLIGNLSPIHTEEPDGKGKHFEYYYKLSTLDDGSVGAVPFLADDPPVDPKNVEPPLPLFIDKIDPGAKATNNRPICSFVQFAP